MKPRHTVPLLVAFVVLASDLPSALGAARPADGFIDGREHEVRVRSVLATLPAPKSTISKSARVTAAAAIATCDPTAVSALGRKFAPTPRDQDLPTACVVAAPAEKKDSELFLLGPARLTGSNFEYADAEKADKGRRRITLALSPRGEALWQLSAAAVGTTPLAVTLDGKVVDVTPVEIEPGTPTSLELVLGGSRGFTSYEATRMLKLFGQARHEEVIELARAASMSRTGRTLFASTSPRIDEKAPFPAHCPTPKDSRTFVLGCYNSSTELLYILRVERADLNGIMPVTAAHELLHVAYHRLSDSKRKAVDTMITEFLAANSIPHLQETLAEYDTDPRVQRNEAHSLVGTEVRNLPLKLKKYYAQYFDDRVAVVTMFESYQQVFDRLEAEITRLGKELPMITVRLRELRLQTASADAEADRLFREIGSLRSQGRIGESNNLVGAQNAAADRADSFRSRYFTLVDEYNAKVAEYNALALAADELFDMARA